MADPINPTPAPAPAPSPAAPAAPTPNPGNVAPDPTSSASSAIAAKLSALFPDGRLPEDQPLRAGEKTPGNPSNVPASSGPSAATGATGAPADPAQTGATGLAATGATGPAATGATGATGTPPAETGPSAAELDKAEAGMPIQAGTAFKFVRTELKTKEAALAEAHKKIADLEAAQSAVPEVDKAEFERVKARATEQEKELATVRIQATEQFKKEIQIPMDKAEGTIKRLATHYNVPESDLIAAVNDTDEASRSTKLSDLSANFNRFDLVKFDQAVVELEGLKGKANELISSASDRYKAMQDAQAATASKSREEFTANWQKALGSSFTKLETDLPVFKATGDPEWDKAVVEMRDKVRATNVAEIPNEEIATSFYKAGMFPLVLNLVSDLHGQNATLQERIAVLEGTSASPAAGQTPPPAVPGAVPEGATFADIAKQRLAGVLPP